MQAQRVKTLKELALALKLGKTTNADFYGWQFRKNKSTDDINHALRKAHNPKYTFGKFEFEVNMLETYLNDILKRDRSIKD